MYPHDLQTDEAARGVLKGAGLRVTSIRLAVLRVLNAGREAMNAQGVLDRLRELAAEGRMPRGEATVDRVTVYRTLNSLVDSGLAHKVDPGDRVFRFSLTDHARCTRDLHQHQHPHFVCDECGTVECMRDAEVIVKTPQPAAGVPERPRRVTQQEILLHGTCDRCTDDEPTAHANGAVA